MADAAGDEARRALEDHRVKVVREVPEVARGADGLPSGDPGSGVMLVLEPPWTPAVLDALRRSLDAVGWPQARVVAPDEHLLRELLSCEPAALVALGPGAARAVDDLEYPLARSRFTETPVGEWFAWSRSARGLALPPLAPALEDEEAKRDFWRRFLALRGLCPM